MVVYPVRHVKSCRVDSVDLCSCPAACGQLIFAAYGWALVCDLLPRSLPELLVAALEASLVGQVHRAARQVDQLPMDLLQPRDEHRAVRFPEDRRSHLNDVVGPDGEEEPIERGVMELAQRDAGLIRWVSQGFPE